MDCKEATSDANGEKYTTCTVQQPGEVIRPVVSKGMVEDIIHKMYGLTVTEVKELDSYDDRNYFVRVEEQHSNPFIQELHPEGYLLKVINSKDSMNSQGLEAQHAFMNCLLKNGIQTQMIVLNINREEQSLEITSHTDEQGELRKHLVDLRTFVPGQIIQNVPYTPQLLMQDGVLIARMAYALKEFDHSFYRDRDILWSMTNVPLLTRYTFSLQNKAERDIIEDIVSAFNTEVVSKYEQLPKGYIHGDPNEQNILVSKSHGGGDYEISGILDFSDVANSYLVLDLAMNIAYLMIDSEVVDQLDTPGYILAGYESIRQLTPVEWDVIFVCIAGRLAQSLTLGAHANYLEPENIYVLTTSKKGWPLLQKFWSQPKDSIISRWKKIIASCKVNQ
ncbi:hydroxylysine kinase-like [Haliotis rufescens]|uniref:hydroxylysine kinase-like n=1 Tax=Haliotis rufescens TaxID=6454 RepID=UPI00201ED637|nr:hydroxylysine kinase-like [Haliotis rufescens]XP_046329603.2 hydroxylysine kinase-like [Haliotis rufescens]XP_046329606.2 hydroxylysine kinase-like [Haliotis rufescens]XP_046329607.2 hydroxylysine kinase-like [Haliotis rufescens]